MAHIIFCHSGPFYALLPPPPPIDPENQNFEKMQKILRYHFPNVYPKWQSYHVWFLRYGVQWKESLVILDSFFAFLPP